MNRMNIIMKRCLSFNLVFIFSILFVVLTKFTVLVHGAGEGTAVPATEATASSKDNQAEKLASEAKIYSQLFKQQRMMQREAVRSIVGLKSYEKQYQMMHLVLDKLFKVLEDSRVVLTDAGYIPGDEIPENETLRDAVSKIAENTAFFGDLVLRLPDLTHRLYDKNNEWNALLTWGIKFCNNTGLFNNGDNQKLINLMSQELKLIDRDPTYVNPYSEDNLKKHKFQDTKPLVKKKKKKKKARGPQMSREEL